MQWCWTENWRHFSFTKDYALSYVGLFITAGCSVGNCKLYIKTIFLMGIQPNKKKMHFEQNYLRQTSIVPPMQPIRVALLFICLLYVFTK